MDYQTRHLVALKIERYDGRPLRTGDVFVATHVDAGYFTKHGRARDATPEEVLTFDPGHALNLAPEENEQLQDALGRISDLPTSSGGDAGDDLILRAAPAPALQAPPAEAPAEAPAPAPSEPPAPPPAEPEAPPAAAPVARKVAAKTPARAGTTRKAGG